MKDYINNTTQEILTAELINNGSNLIISTTSNPQLTLGALLQESCNQDNPQYQVTGDSVQASDGSWQTVVEQVIQEYKVSYSFITITHSTIAGSMNQSAGTKAEAIELVRDWLVKIYQPVEFDNIWAE